MGRVPGRPLAALLDGACRAGTAGGGGRDGVVMAGGAVRESVTIAGYPERVAVARAFAAAVLGRPHPAVETAVLLLSELVANSVRAQRFRAAGPGGHGDPPQLRRRHPGAGH
jgi:hypothetical protein